MSIASLGVVLLTGAGCNKNSATEPAATNSVALPSTNLPAAGLTNVDTNTPAARGK